MREGRKKGGVVAMPANEWMGGAEIRDCRKQRERGGRKGRRAGLTRISAPWLLGLGVILTL